VRTYGWKTGLLVLLLDVAKGMLSVSLPLIFKLAAPGSEQMTNLQVLTGSMAILGHLFPVFADFRGGKGVATIFGIVLFMQPEIALICAVVFLVTILISGIASVSSLIAVTFFPILVIFVYKTPVKSMMIFSICVAVLLFLTHRANIKRLIKGEEKRLFSLFGKK
jgi:glycerol-3-phosphate acyltransferase PlsY